MKRNSYPARQGTGQLPLNACPWCGAALNFTPAYPVTSLAPGEARSVRLENIPAPLRTVPAWTCSTPHCRYREPA
jgi:hypothetical protein